MISAAALAVPVVGYQFDQVIAGRAIAWPDVANVSWTIETADL
jgi:hypothetical protein